MSAAAPVILVVDDDASIRKSVSRLLRSAGYEVETYAAASELAEQDWGERPRCAILDVELPGSSGLELGRELSAWVDPPPIVYITGHGDIPMGVQAMKEGAVDFLPKPFQADELIGAVDRALARDVVSRGRRRETEQARDLVAALTPREFETLRWVISGHLNKQIGRRLGITEKTVKVHRGRVMRKLEVTSVADLVRLAERAGIPPAAG